jgi:CRP-like cAMP-binding protein
MMCLSGSRLESPNDSNTSLSSESSPSALLAQEIEKLSTGAHSTQRHLFRQGEEACALYLVKSGEVMYSVDWAGETKLCYTVGPDSLAGLSAVFAERPYAFTATASPERVVSSFFRTFQQH